MRYFLYVIFISCALLFFFFYYEERNRGRTFNLIDFVKVFLLEFLSIIYAVITWIPGFFPFDEFIPRRGNIKIPVFIYTGFFTKLIALPIFLNLTSKGFENVFILTSLVLDEKYILSLAKSKAKTLGYEKFFFIGFSIGGNITSKLSERDEVLRSINISSSPLGTKLKVFFPRKFWKFLEPFNVNEEKNFFIVPEFDEFFIPNYNGNEKISLGHISIIFSKKLSNIVSDIIISSLQK